MFQDSGYPHEKTRSRGPACRSPLGPSASLSRPPQAAENHARSACGTLFLADTRCQKKGLTLVELLAVIGVIVITASLGAFFLKNQLPKLRLYEAASDLAAALERARRLSVSEQMPHGIKFALADKTYVLLKFQPALLTLATSTLPQSVSFYSTTTPFANDTARFNALGGAAEAGAIILQTDEGSAKTIKLNPSGYVQVE